MAPVKIVHRKLIGILCMLAFVLAGLSFFQHQKIKTLTRAIGLQTAETGVGTASAARKEVPVQQLPVGSSDDMNSLRAELAEIEQKLEAANSRIYEETVAESEKEEKERENWKERRRYWAEDKYGPLFDDLNLSMDKIEKFIDFHVEMTMELSPHIGTFEENSAEWAAEIRRLETIEAEREANIKALLGDAGYEAYTAYKDRYLFKASVGYFAGTLSIGEAMTPKQQEALAEIFYENQAPTSTFEELSEETKSIHAKIVKDAEKVLTSSQLEYLKKFFERQRLSMERRESLEN